MDVDFSWIHQIWMRPGPASRSCPGLQVRIDALIDVGFGLHTEKGFNLSDISLSGEKESTSPILRAPVQLVELQ
jgi:hypothetical protein